MNKYLTFILNFLVFTLLFAFFFHLLDAYVMHENKSVGLIFLEGGIAGLFYALFDIFLKRLMAKKRKK